MADLIEDLERIAAALRAQRDQEIARLGKLGDGIQEVAGYLREDMAARDLAERRLESIRAVVDGFLSDYGDSGLPEFMVAQDMANSIRTRLDGNLDEL